MEAVVVFTEDNTHWLSGLLRPSHRHVFCCVPSPHDDGTSVSIDLTIDGIRVTPHAGTPRELARFYNTQGLEAWLVDYTPEKRLLLPLFLNNCVGLTKHLLGIRSFATTPWQLRRHIAKEYDQWQVSSLSPV